MLKAASKSLTLLAVVASFSMPAAAQFLTPIAQSARSGALGGIFLYSPQETFVAADYRRAFMLDALADKTVRLQMVGGRQGTVLAAWSHRGNSAWHEQQLALGYGMQITTWLHAAVGARLLLRGTDDAHYEHRQWLAPSALLQASWQNTQLTLLAGTRPWDTDRLHPWRIHLQAAYHPLPQWLAIAEWEHEERSRLRIGMEYAYEGCWFLRAGMATHPAVFTFGIGTRQYCFSIDLSVEVHDALGITPQTSLALWF